MECNCKHHDIVISELCTVQLILGSTLILADVPYFAYNIDMTGCFVLDNIDQDILKMISSLPHKYNVQFMIFDLIGVLRKTIDNISIWNGLLVIPIRNIKININYQFGKIAKLTTNTNYDGMIKNPYTGRWSFL